MRLLKKKPRIYTAKWILWTRIPILSRTELINFCTEILDVNEVEVEADMKKAQAAVEVLDDTTLLIALVIIDVSVALEAVQHQRVNPLNKPSIQ